MWFQFYQTDGRLQYASYIVHNMARDAILENHMNQSSYYRTRRKRKQNDEMSCPQLLFYGTFPDLHGFVENLTCILKCARKEVGVKQTMTHKLRNQLDSYEAFERKGGPSEVYFPHLFFLQR